MKQYESVIKVMEDNGGYATLGYLYINALNVEGCEWKTKTPFASIRRIVQDDRFFFKIRPGLWALKSYKNKLPPEVYPDEKFTENEKDDFTHSYYQGLLVEIGNLENKITFIPNQDKNKNFLNKKLREISTIDNIFEFSYERFVRKAKTVDVVWFNERKMQEYMFEVEHSTNFINSIIKFIELQDFNIKFFVISSKNKEKSFYDKISGTAFDPIRKRVKLINYDELSTWHNRTYEDKAFKNKLKIL